MKNGFSIRLMDCGNERDLGSPGELESPFRQSHQKRLKHTEIAGRFHNLPLPLINRALFREIEFGRDYDEAERAGVLALLNKHDAFMMECFLPRREGLKKGDKMPSRVVK